MRAAIHNPYLDTLGGGERYTLAVASLLEKKGYSVDIEWADKRIGDSFEKRFGIDLEGINFAADIKRGDGYDLCFWVSDGSIPALRSRKNILHFQVPFKDLNANTLINRMKLLRINKVVCNSEFTKRFIDREFGIKSMVIYPPVSTSEIKPKKKKNVILFVGRFSQLKQSKNQDVLIDVFKKLYPEVSPNWKLILAGGIEVGVGEYLSVLKKRARKYPIEFIESPSFSELKKLYSSAKIFWSASGYGVDEDRNPEMVEHFGISVVEAMSAGAVPLIFNAGGHKEIIGGSGYGLLWKKKNELLKNTLDLIDNKALLEEISKNVIVKSKDFGYENFEKEFEKII